MYLSKACNDLQVSQNDLVAKAQKLKSSSTNLLNVEGFQVLDSKAEGLRA